jgi:hypothetical protein
VKNGVSNKWSKRKMLTRGWRKKRCRLNMADIQMARNWEVSQEFNEKYPFTSTEVESACKRMDLGTL